jgi:hypothetical protein
MEDGRGRRDDKCEGVWDGGNDRRQISRDWYVSSAEVGRNTRPEDAFSFKTKDSSMSSRDADR